MLTVLDEYTREALCVAAKSRMGHAEVLEALYPLFLNHGKPENHPAGWSKNWEHLKCAGNSISNRYINRELDTRSTSKIVDSIPHVVLGKDIGPIHRPTAC